MLAEIKSISAKEKALLDRLANIDNVPPATDFVDTSDCDQEERRTARDRVDEANRNGAAGGDREKSLKGGPEKVKKDPGNVMPSTFKSTAAIDQPFDRNQRENAFNTGIAGTPISSSPTVEQQTGTGEGEKFPRI